MRQIFAVAAAFLIAISAKSQENYNLTIVGQLTFPGKTCANIGGYVDSLGNEYALVGTSTGLSIVDVTEPTTPTERFAIASVPNFWREVKTWQGYAFVTTEGTNAGLTIVDLRSLPDTIFTKVYKGDGAILNQLLTIHALHIDNNYCYLYGHNISNEGVIILDLEDPWNPVYTGAWNENYIHDGFVANDTLWACHIFEGHFSAIDVTDKTNPVQIVQQETPGNFTHNSWLTDDHATLLTTDENSGSFLTSYDIRNVNNITELDRYQTSPGTGTIGHNTHVLNDFAVTSWYTEGVVIVDADRPDNLIPVAKNDFTTFEGDGFHGCWGVYPFLPSGNLVASDIENGLYVLTPVYKRACYLEGIVIDSSCAEPLKDVVVTIVSQDEATTTTTLQGIFKTGTVNAGLYTITFEKAGYQTTTLTNVELQNGVVTYFEINLYSDAIVGITGNITDNSGAPIEDALIDISDPANSFLLNSNSTGEYGKCDLLPNTYQISFGKWGNITDCIPAINISGANTVVNAELPIGYYDDFQFNFGWTSTGTASSGFWEREVPSGTNLNGVPAAPGIDVDGDCNGIAFVTGNTIGATVGEDDVDAGNVVLTSPIMDLTAAGDPYIHLHRWFFNGGGAGNTPPPANDALKLQLKKDGVVINVKNITIADSMSAWIPEIIRVRDYFPNLGLIQLVVSTEDVDPGNVLEAGIDQFQVVDSGIINSNGINLEQQFIVFPNPSSNGGYIKLSDNQNNYSLLEIYDLSGRLVEKYNISEKENIQFGQALQPGAYLLRLAGNGNHSSMKKWIKN
jgi:choice-of-anchor B domain-containing protein